MLRSSTRPVNRPTPHSWRALATTSTAEILRSPSSNATSSVDWRPNGEPKTMCTRAVIPHPTARLASTATGRPDVADDRPALRQQRQHGHDDDESHRSDPPDGGDQPTNPVRGRRQHRGDRVLRAGIHPGGQPAEDDHQYRQAQPGGIGAPPSSLAVPDRSEEDGPPGAAPLPPQRPAVSAVAAAA